MKTPVIKSNKFILRPFRKGDEESLKENINNKKIHQNTLGIPYPYSLKDARAWIERNLKEMRSRKPKMLNFVIDVNKEVAGSVGFHKIEGHKAELGYWLAEKYWNRGIMTEAVKLVTKFGFEKLKFARICALVFPFNKASAKVLKKNSFKYEGKLRKHTKKGNKFLDDLLFAKIR